MAKVVSADGTSIDYDRRGAGPPVILIGGATQHRAVDRGTERLADLLAAGLTVINYDRRGRGDSTDTAPYAVAREIDDIAALVEAAGGRAYLYGMSSGAILGIEAAAALGGKVGKLACYEPPIDITQSGDAAWASHRAVSKFADAGDGAGAFVEFMTQVGTPQEAIDGMKQGPAFEKFAKVGHTIPYDLRIVAEATEHGLPHRWQDANKPALIIDGDQSYPFMAAGADAVAKALPNATRMTLKGQSHDVSPDVLAPVLLEFYRA